MSLAKNAPAMENGMEGGQRDDDRLHGGVGGFAGIFFADAAGDEGGGSHREADGDRVNEGED